MAPDTGPASSLDEVDKQVKAIVQNLYNLIVQSYDYDGTQSAEAMTREIHSLLTSLKSLTRISRSLPLRLPPEIIAYISDGRNPDIYTREFVELVQRHNQFLKGRAEAFAAFGGVLAAEMMTAMPEVRDDILCVLASTYDSVAALEARPQEI
ncbi:RNA polymerase-like protein II mediator complex subunit 10 [Cryomyces antarcticus]|nr:Mediator of RNA polymerase II transcription subunit 10 [Cryomyces antarcticus]